MNSEATCLGGYLGRRIFGKGIGASDKSCEMGALAGGWVIYRDGP